MLVIDEIQQLVGLETFLRRLGFDVLSLGKDALVADALLSFHPEIVVASHASRNVDGIGLSKRLKKTMKPPPRIALSYTGTPPVLAKEDEKSVDALLEIPAAGESAIHLFAKLGAFNAEPLLEKYRKFSTARLTQDEQVVIVQGRLANDAKTTVGGSAAAAVETQTLDWDPVKTPGQSATARSERSNRYDTFLENHAKDLGKDAAKKVLPRERAAQLMKQLKEDSKSEKDLLDEIQAQKIKFAEALFDEEKSEEKKKK